MAQTLHISASFERFSHNLFTEQNGRPPTAAEMKQIHQNNLKTAAHLTELHLERTRKIRPAVGAETEEGGMVHRYIDQQHFHLIDNRLQLDAETMPQAMQSEPIDSSDGRIGCPGKDQVPGIWKWIEEVSDHYSYRILDAHNPEQSPTGN